VSDLELERKFIVGDYGVLVGASDNITQFYPLVGNSVSVRLRLTESGGLQTTLKSRHDGIARKEVESVLPLTEEERLDLMSGSKAPSGRITKRRYLGDLASPIGTWLIDEFGGDNKGLVVAEFEISKETIEKNGAQKAIELLGALEIPTWCGAEVTDDFRFRNEYLALNPFTKWPPQDRKEFDRYG